jgi:phage-related protein
MNASDTYVAKLSDAVYVLHAFQKRVRKRFVISPMHDRRGVGQK